MKKLFTIIIATAMLSLLATTAFAAPSAAVSWTTLSHAEAWPDCTIGYDFKVGAQDIWVSALGYYDELGDGLTYSHAVGIWGQSGTPLITATVLSGTDSVLSDKYRYTGISAIKLWANTTYTIGGQNAGEQFGRSDAAVGFTMNSLLTGVGPSRYINGAGLNKPISGPYWTQGPIYAGPNMMIASVPEPGTILAALSILAPAGILFRRRRA